MGKTVQTKGKKAIGAPETVRHSRQQDSDFEAEKRRWATGARIWRD
jgi:hypothetical protein